MKWKHPTINRPIHNDKAKHRKRQSFYDPVLFRIIRHSSEIGQIMMGSKPRTAIYTACFLRHFQIPAHRVCLHPVYPYFKVQVRAR